MVLRYIDNKDINIYVVDYGWYEVFVDAEDGREYVCISNIIYYLEDMEEVNEDRK